MHLFRPLALALTLTLPAFPALAQSFSSAPASNSSSSQSQAQQPGAESQGQLSVQARIRMRREQRRATAIHDAYDHLFESYVNLGYLRFTPGPDLQRTTFYGWDTGLTRYYSERLGVNLEARGYSGIAFVGLNPYGLTRPQISQYNVMAGPTYRFYMQPKYSISGRAEGGWAYGNFSGDTGSLGSIPNGKGGTLLYPDGSTFAASVSVIGDYNISPAFALRLAPEYFFNGFGSTVQASRGFTIGLVYRFGKQQ